MPTMANSRQKLELTWIGKESRPKLEPRVLIEDPERSYHAKFRITGSRGGAQIAENDGNGTTNSAPSAPPREDFFDNRLIFGDNLLALKALEQEFTGKIKCIYIDPPYNAGSAFTHYDDGIEHSLWLSLMRDRRVKSSKPAASYIFLADGIMNYRQVVDQGIAQPAIRESHCALANDAMWYAVTYMRTMQQLCDPERLELFCRAWGVVELSLFGSVLRDDFRSDSDVDVLVQFADQRTLTLESYTAMREELSALFNGRTIDLVEMRRLADPYRRHEILRTREIIYGH